MVGFLFNIYLMKKFTKLVLENENQKYYETHSKLKLFIKASNEGEAAYKSDSILGSIEGQIDFSIDLIEEISKDEYQQYFESITGESEEETPISLYMGKYSSVGIEMTDEERISSTWGALFGNSNPNTQQRMEFYHRMREAGIDGTLIFNFLKNPIKKI